MQSQHDGRAFFNGYQLREFFQKVQVSYQPSKILRILENDCVAIRRPNRPSARRGGKGGHFTSISAAVSLLPRANQTAAATRKRVTSGMSASNLCSLVSDKSGPQGT